MFYLSQKAYKSVWTYDFIHYLPEFPEDSIHIHDVTRKGMVIEL